MQWRIVLLFHKQRQRRRVAVQKILVADGPNLAVAEETRQPGEIKMRLHQRRIVARTAEKVFPAAIAAKQAATINLAAREFLFGPVQQLVQGLVGVHGITPLKLDGLAHARQGAHGQDA